ncbi:MAG: helicase HerA-like domain-containing protein, partial [Pseudomonadota bacterium]
MLQDGKIYIGTSIVPADPDAAPADGAEIVLETVKPEYLNLGLANRHGLITGATGTGKTVTMQVLAEGFAAAGVPVFAADIKGDLSGISKPGSMNGFIERRNAAIGLEQYENRGYPTVFWDLFGKQGHPIRTTVADMGPLLLARLLDLNETQEGVLTILFRVAADDNIPLVDLKDLRAMLNEIAEQRKEIATEYGNVAVASIGAIQRRLLVLEDQGGDQFFGEPAFQLGDLMKTTYDGLGFVNILAADELMQRPQLYATFLLWMLTELWNDLPEVG